MCLCLEFSLMHPCNTYTKIKRLQPYNRKNQFNSHTELHTNLVALWPAPWSIQSPLGATWHSRHMFLGSWSQATWCRPHWAHGLSASRRTGQYLQPWLIHRLCRFPQPAKYQLVVIRKPKKSIWFAMYTFLGCALNAHFCCQPFNGHLPQEHRLKSAHAHFSNLMTVLSYGDVDSLDKSRPLRLSRMK